MDIKLVGDIHSDWEVLFRKLDHYEIRDCTLIHVGDGGEGFIRYESQMRQFEHFNQCFKKRNIYYMSVRGNHSDPQYFQGQIKLSNFELLPDYTYRKIGDQTFLFVGGAISIDRRIRSKNISWWEDEKFVLKPELVKPCDVLVTHSAPSWIGNWTKRGIESWCEKDTTLWEECLVERQLHDELIKLCKPKKHFAGHFHSSVFASLDGCDSRILDCLEIFEYRK